MVLIMTGIDSYNPEKSMEEAIGIYRALIKDEAFKKDLGDLEKALQL